MSDIEVTLTDNPDELAEYAQEGGSVIRSEEDEKRIMTRIQDEVLEVLEGDVYTEMREKWKKWRRQREAVPEQETKNFPWEGASNVSVPLAMMTTNGITSLLKSSLMERSPFWDVTRRGTITDKVQADALEAFLEALSESPYHLNLKNHLGPIAYDLVSLGTAFIKVPWVADKWTFRRDDGQVVEKLRSASPKVINIPLEDFLMQPYFDDVQRAPWVGQVVYLTEHELRARERIGVFENVDAVINGGASGVTEGREETMDRMGIALGTKDKSGMYAIIELYIYEDADGDGFTEDLKLWVHPETGTFLRAEFNSLGVRPIARLTYFDRPGELYGIGVGWIVERLQDEIDALHNMRIDGTMLSMLQMYVTSRGSNIAPGEEWRPLKHLEVDDASRDFTVVKFPDISPGTIQAEYVTKEYADRATGATDAMMGFESFAGSSRRTASGTMFLAQQNMRTLQPVIDSIEDAFSEIGRLATFQLVRNKDFLEDQVLMVPPEHQAALKELLGRIEIEDIPSSFQFRIKTTDMQKTEEAKRQAKLTLIQLYVTYGQQVFQMLPMIYGQNANVPPQIKQVAAKFFVGATNMMDEVFSFFGDERSDKYLPYVKDIELMLQAMDMAKEQQVGGLYEQINRAATRGGGQMGNAPGGPTGPAGPQGGPGMGGNAAPMGGGAGPQTPGPPVG